MMTVDIMILTINPTNPFRYHEIDIIFRMILLTMPAMYNASSVDSISKIVGFLMILKAKILILLINFLVTLFWLLRSHGTLIVLCQVNFHLKKLRSSGRIVLKIFLMKRILNGWNSYQKF